MYSKIFIIAEAGINHNGNLKNALKMIDVAAEAGTDAIKFQTFTTYRKYKKYKFTRQEHIILITHCMEKGIIFMSTPWDFASIDMLADLGMWIWKIPSSEITNEEYLKRIGRLKRKVVMSTGMSNIKEIWNAIRILERQKTKDITILHCTSLYPPKIEEMNILAFHSLKQKFGISYALGFSDHSVNDIASISALTMLLSDFVISDKIFIFEKHFMLDTPCPDENVSITSHELKQYIRNLHVAEKMLGNSSEKKCLERETKNLHLRNRAK